MKIDVIQMCHASPAHMVCKGCDGRPSLSDDQIDQNPQVVGFLADVRGPKASARSRDLARWAVRRLAFLACSGLSRHLALQQVQTELATRRGNSDPLDLVTETPPCAGVCAASSWAASHVDAGYLLDAGEAEKPISQQIADAADMESFEARVDEIAGAECTTIEIPGGFSSLRVEMPSTVVESSSPLGQIAARMRAVKAKAPNIIKDLGLIPKSGGWFDPSVMPTGVKLRFLVVDADGEFDDGRVTEDDGIPKIESGEAILAWRFARPTGARPQSPA